MWTPTHVVVTVTKARNLLEKGKGGNDAYCMIGMGKEKFLTSVKPKTLTPVWDEQAEFALGEREDLKITVYHKSSVIDEFVGRIIIDVAELAGQDNSHSYLNWYKLAGKKEEKNKKPEKDRGEIEVRIDFVIKPKAGSMMDLSIQKSKEKSGSLRNLREKMSIKDKLSKLKKSGQPKYSGENQLAEQAKRMAGSKLDFLEGDDIGSIASSYSSINGPTLSRNGQFNRFNTGRQSFLSKASSRGPENDSSSIYGNDNSRNDEDFDDHFKIDDESDRDSLNSSSFQRRNSSRFNSSLSRKISSRNKQAPSNQDNTDMNEENREQNGSSIHIAPLLPFNNTSTPQLAPRVNHDNNNKNSEKRQRHKTSSSIVATIDEENILSVKSPEKETQKDQTDSFASIFTASLSTENNGQEQKKNNHSKNTNTSETHSTITDSFEKTQSSGFETSSSTNSNRQKKNAPVVSIVSKDANSKKSPSHNPFLNGEKSPEEMRKDFKKNASNPFLDEDEESSSSFSIGKSKKQAPVIPVFTKNAKNMNNFPMAANNDEDNIEWDSSEDEEIVKKEVASFERNQLMRQSERRRLVPVEDLTSDLNSETDFNHSTCSISSSVRNRHSNGNKNNTRSNFQLDLKPEINNNDDIKTPNFDIDEAFQDHFNNEKNKMNNNANGSVHNSSGLPDLINQKGNKDVPTDKARKYLEGLDGVKFNEVQVPDTLKKQLEYFDRDELLQLIAYQKKYLDFKETRIKDLENYIDNLVVKIIETEPLILMNASNVLTKSKNVI